MFVLEDITAILKQGSVVIPVAKTGGWRPKQQSID